MLLYGLFVFSLLLVIFFKLLMKFYPNHIKSEDGFYYLDEVEEQIHHPKGKVISNTFLPDESLDLIENQRVFNL